MIFKQVNFLFEDFSRKDLGMTTEQFLTSKELQEELTDVFGDNFYSKKLCHQVCKKVVELSEDSDVQAVTNILVYLKTEEEYELISSKGHCVVLYKNKLYDYTSDQYANYGVSEVGGLRILSETSDITEFDDMEIGDARVFVNGAYVILLMT
jgi:hypothetical protein